MKDLIPCQTEKISSENPGKKRTYDSSFCDERIKVLKIGTFECLGNIYQREIINMRDTKRQRNKGQDKQQHLASQFDRME